MRNRGYLMKYPRIRNEIFVNTQVDFRGYLKNWVSCVELFVPLIESILFVHLGKTLYEVI